MLHSLQWCARIGFTFWHLKQKDTEFIDLIISLQEKWEFLWAILRTKNSQKNLNTKIIAVQHSHQYLPKGNDFGMQLIGLQARVIKSFRCRSVLLGFFLVSASHFNIALIALRALTLVGRSWGSVFALLFELFLLFS